MSKCGNFSCSKCCHEREIVLTHEDIDRLLTMGHYEQVFAKPSRWGYNLKELIFQNGDCIFLQNDSCSVYQNRPTACRIFPYTSSGNGGVIDPSCPHATDFTNDESFVHQAQSGLNRIIRDIEDTISKARKTGKDQ